MRFSSPGVLPSSETSTSQQWRQLMLISCEGNHCSTGEGCDETGPSSRYEAGFFSPYIIVPKKSSGLRPILGLRILNWAFHKLPFKMLTQKRIFGCIRPEIGLKWSTWRTRTSMCRSFRATGHSCGLRSKDGHISTTSCPSGCPYRHMSSQSSGGSPCSLERTGRVHPQIHRPHAHTGSVSGSDIRTQGFGTLAPQPVGSGSTGKRANSPRCRGSLFLVWS